MTDRIEVYALATDNHVMSLENKAVISSYPNPSLDQARTWAYDLGFAGLSAVQLTPGLLKEPMELFRRGLERGFGADMSYLWRHQDLREDPALLLPGARSVLMAFMPYLPPPPDDAGYRSSNTGSTADWRHSEAKALDDPQRAVISVYARGRDYHKVLRQRLSRLAQILNQAWGPGRFRACVDSAPLMEVELAQRSGLGWRGKNTLLLNTQYGSMFFLGALLTDLVFSSATESVHSNGHCGTCTSCLDLCPTTAFVGPFQLDARRCISYLTIEHKEDIPELLRPLIGNRVYGCDDCQRVCPWNRYAQVSTLADFKVRDGLDQASLLTLFEWTEQEFINRHQGSAILRIGYARWLRNLAVGLGNALARAVEQDDSISILTIRCALQARAQIDVPMVRRHVQWALTQESVSK